MEEIKDNFCGSIKVDDYTYTYYVSDYVVTLLPAQSDRIQIYNSFDNIQSHDISEPEFLFGDDNHSEIAILRNGKFITDPFGINTTVKFGTPLIVKACGNTSAFYDMFSEEWNKFHAISFYGGNINALYNPSLAIKSQNGFEPSKYDGSRTIKILPWVDYTKTIEFQVENQKVTLTISIGHNREHDDVENKEAYNLGKMISFFRFSFEKPQGFEKIEKYYMIAKKIVAILTAQNNVCFEKINLSQRSYEQKFYPTGTCKIFERYENYSIRKEHQVISIKKIFDYIPNLINLIIDNKIDALLELLPEDNRMVNRITIKNIQDICTALEISYNLNHTKKREKDNLIEELKKNIKNTIAEFIEKHNEIDINKETTISSAFQYLDYTLKEKIITLYKENKDLVDSIVFKYSLPKVNEESVADFVKLRNGKTHSNTFEWNENVKIYSSLFVIVYAEFFKNIGLPLGLIQSVLLNFFS